MGRDRARGEGCSNARRCSSASCRSAARSGARFMNEKLPGVTVPDGVIAALEAAGATPSEVGRRAHDRGRAAASAAIPGSRGVHLMGMGHDDAVRRVVEGAGLFPRPTGSRAARRSIGTQVWSRGPTYSLTGRISLLSAYCSRTCAVHPAIRAARRSASTGRWPCRARVGRWPRRSRRSGTGPSRTIHDLLDDLGDLEPPGVAGAARPSSPREVACRSRARGSTSCNAVAEPHDPLACGQAGRGRGPRPVRRADLLEHLHGLFVGPAVQRAFERGDGGR